jgi:pantoate--beta-alanine ligase
MTFEPGVSRVQSIRTKAERRAGSRTARSRAVAFWGEHVELIQDRLALRRRLLELRRAGLQLGFVPTMGALHAGHLSLLQRARAGCDRVAVSIFVNPMQFGPGEDLERYPRDLAGDLRQLEAAGCDLAFAPSAADMYAPEARTSVQVRDLEERLCGASRPGHFRGVATVVAKLFNLMQPEVAVFGQKDAQQAVLLRRMVRDLDFPIELRFAPIVRDADGLALSSRNVYLSPEERREALLLHAALQRGLAVLESGERRASVVVETARHELESGARVRVDYVELVDVEALRPVPEASGEVLFAVAAFVGRTRLIDNLVLAVDPERVREVELRG